MRGCKGADYFRFISLCIELNCNPVEHLCFMYLLTAFSFAGFTLGWGFESTAQLNVSISFYIFEKVIYLN